MRPRQRAEVGAAGRDDRVHLIGGRDVPDRDGRDTTFVADHLGERGLEHAAVHRVGPARGLACRHVDDVGTVIAEQRRNLQAVFRR